jgi:hypothetical protein
MPTQNARDVTLLSEADNSHKLTRPLIIVRTTMFIEAGTYIPDLLTRVRILETVASVSQDREFFEYKNPEALPVDATLASSLPTKVETLKDVTSTSGRDVVNVLIRFLPKAVTIGDAIKEIAARLHGIPGVRTIRFDELNGRPLTVGGKPVVF